MISTQNKTKSKTRYLKWIIIAVILIFAIFAYTYFRPDDKQPNYITATAKKGDIEETVMASGKIRATNTVNVGAQVSGEITKLYVKVGDTVKKGDLIAQIDPTGQKNQLNNSQASLTQTISDLESIEASLKNKYANLESAKAFYAAKKAELNKASSYLKRIEPLLKINAISQQDYDDTVTAMIAAEAALISAKSNVKTAEADIMSTKATISGQKASVQKSQTTVNNAIKDLKYTTITAPIDGTVVYINKEQGSTVNANQSAPTIVTLADLSQVRINAQISEADVSKVKAGLPVYFNVIGNPDEKFNAKLTGIEPAPETISTNSQTNSAIYYIGYVETPNKDKKFRIDMTTQLHIIINKAKNVLTIPSAAIENIKNNEGIVRVLKNGEIEEKKVKVGINNRVDAQILSGLSPDDTVILQEENIEEPIPAF